MPAAVRTPSGVISAPGFAGRNPTRQVAYGGSSTPDSIDATYRIDRDTTQPANVEYDDPFTPSIAPFKRLYAFDAVDSELELVVRDKRTRPVSVGGSLRPGDDHFFGDLFVDLAAGTPVRIPSVGPGTRVLALRTEPEVALEVVRDGAENLFIVGQERRRVRLILELAAPRAAFGSEFPNVSYEALAPHVPELPPEARAVVNEVLERLGLSRDIPPARAIGVLVAHFRSFAPSNDLPVAESGSALYRELVLSKKGVCRHRAYGFVLTALGLGIPARFVRNEAHAWVEVGDGRLFRRIDLGGAAHTYDIDTQRGAPPHNAPPDPFPWPEGAHSGADAASGSGNRSSDRDDAQPSGGPTGRTDPNAPASTPDGADTAALAPPPPPEVTSPAPPSATRPSRVELRVANADVRRGTPLQVSGHVTSASLPCPGARVDIALQTPEGTVLIGSVPTDRDGRFDSRVTVPFDIDVGEYVLRASTPGAGECGPSE